MNTGEIYRGVGIRLSQDLVDGFCRRSADPTHDERSWRETILAMTRETLDALIDLDNESEKILAYSTSMCFGLVLYNDFKAKTINLATILPVRKDYPVRTAEDVFRMIEQDCLATVDPLEHRELEQEGMCHIVRLYDASLIAVLYEGKYYDGDYVVIVVG